MNDASFDKLKRTTAAGMVNELLGPNAHQKAQKAFHEAVSRHVDQMTKDGEAFRMSDEEVRMIQSFRRFRANCRKDGEVFKWQTRKPSPAEQQAQLVERPIVEPSAENGLIEDPQEVS